MTTIVGIVENGTAYIGADSTVLNGWKASTLKEPKVFQRGPFLIGVCGSTRFFNIVAHGDWYKDTPPDEPESPIGYIMRVLANPLRLVTKDNGAIHSEDGEDSSEGGLLVAYKGDIYEIDSKFSVYQHTRGIYACGSGGEYALGALAIIIPESAPPQNRISSALTAAATYDIGSGKPFHIMMQRNIITKRSGDTTVHERWDAVEVKLEMSLPQETIDYINERLAGEKDRLWKEFNEQIGQGRVEL